MKHLRVIVRLRQGQVCGIECLTRQHPWNHGRVHGIVPVNELAAFHSKAAFARARTAGSVEGAASAGIGGFIPAIVPTDLPQAVRVVGAGLGEEIAVLHVEYRWMAVPSR